MLVQACRGTLMRPFSRSGCGVRSPHSSDGAAGSEHGNARSSSFGLLVANQSGTQRCDQARS